jgi:hypothetical protein
MIPNEELNWSIIEGYLSKLFELGVGGSTNYMPIQLLIMSLLSNGNVAELTKNFSTLGKAYEVAVHQVVGDRKNLDILNIPVEVDTKRMMQTFQKAPEIVSNLPEKEKSIIIAIKDVVEKIKKG